ncbi:hypothetical protein Sste5346_006312 [Sporothrix stenoceras]|uniref:Saponin hydrolase n=1 Tax=Sporothrix stenoceras TaxID=5173 RepID=A0ABR3YYL2_9PEZI
MTSMTIFIAGILGLTRAACAIEPIPSPEPISITELPLPPFLGNTSEGACTADFNPRGTGCIAQTGLNSGSFLPDGKHLTATVEFVGAPAAPDPAHIYSGQQLFIIKTDGTTFSNGDTWKCLTCGVPAENQVGATALDAYPQTFMDGTRAMAGTNIVDCGSYQLYSDDCTPDKVYIYPIRLSDTSNDNYTGTGASIRELRLHPDQVHLGFDTFVFSGPSIGEFSFYGRLQFNETGSRYDVVNASVLISTSAQSVITVNGSEVVFDPEGIAVGELRGFTGDGSEILYVGNPVESCNIDIFAIGITTGKVRRVTEHPGYADPISYSYDNNWFIVLDTRGTDRMEFLSALRTVPPVTDLLTVAAVASVRNNGVRRFFRPWLLDHDGDRGLYFGQQLNGNNNTAPGDTNDPYWNSGADPRWSPDGTRVAYYEMFAVSPACGGTNPLPCESNPYADGRQVRVMLAEFTTRTPTTPPIIPEHSDEVPWAIPYKPGMSMPTFTPFPNGVYTLYGAQGGHANVTFALGTTSSNIVVTYHNYTVDGKNVLNGYENVTSNTLSQTLSSFDWYSDLISEGTNGVGTKKTSADGFHFQIDVMTNEFVANGTLTTVVDDTTYNQPCNEC